MPVLNTMQRYRNVAIRATHGGCVLRKAVMSRAFYKLTYHLNYRLGTIYIHGRITSHVLPVAYKCEVEHMNSSIIVM